MKRLTSVPPWRLVVGGLAAIAGMVAVLLPIGREELWQVTLPVCAVIAAAIVVHRPALGMQLFARAAWWANLGLGTILSFLGSHSERLSGVALAGGCGLALLLAGRKGMAEAGERAGYVPSAFRGSLFVLMVLALADAQSFVLFAILQSNGKVGSSAGAMVLVVAAIALIVGFVGLYRLALWGAAVNVSVCGVVFLLAATRSLILDGELRQVLLVLSGLQLAVAVPMIASLLSRHPLPALPARARGLVADALVVLVVAACAVAVAVR